MSDTTSTANMNLTLPVPSERSGPDYAVDINTAISTIDSHDHSTGKGVKVTPAGLDMTTDLDMQGNNLNDVRTVRFENQSAALNSSSDVCTPYFYLGDLWVNNGAGTAVQVTSGSTVLAAAATPNIWESTSITANLTIQASDDFVLINCNNSTAITITLPSAAGVANGRFYIITDAIGNSATYNITLSPNGSNQINGSTSSRTLASAYGTWMIRSDGTSKWQLMYLGHSGLTASSLTYGNTVLSSTGLKTGSTPSTDTTAALQIPNNSIAISARNAANSANLSVLKVNSSNNIELGSSSSAVQLANNTPLYGRNAADSASLSLVKLNSSNTVVVGESSASGISLADDTSVTGTLTTAAITATGTVSVTGTVSINGTLQRSSATTQNIFVPPVNYLTTNGLVVPTRNAPFGHLTGVSSIQNTYGSLLFLVSPTTAAAQGILFDITPYLHNNATLSSVTVYVKGTSGHSGIPLSPPAVGVFRITPGTAALNTLSSSGDFGFDAPASVGAYETSHTFTHTLNQYNTIDKGSYMYVAQVWGECGTYALNSLSYYGLRLNMTSISDIWVP